MTIKSLTIKAVLDSYAAYGPEDSPTLDIYGFTDCEHRVKSLCPLQITVGRNCYYTRSRQLGLSSGEINSIITWADSGKWPIPAHYKRD